MSEPLTDREIIDLLYKYGHFRCPEMGGSPEAGEIRSMAIKDKAVKTALQSYQEWFADDLDQLCMMVHHRDAVIDGEIGPATRLLMNLPRCAVPDYPIEEAASRNWPKDCRGNITTNYKMTLKGLSQQDIRDLITESHNQWNRAIDVRMRLDQEAGSNVKIYTQAEDLSGSTLAWSHLARGSCSSRLSQRFDLRRNWSGNMFITVKTHEDGHALGANHVKDSSATMYPSINKAARGRRGYPNKTDLQEMDRIGYKVSGAPTPDPGDPDPRPDPTPWPQPDPGTNWRDVLGKLCTTSNIMAMLRLIRDLRK